MLFGTQHIVVLLLTIFSCIVLPIFAKKHLNYKQQLWISRSIIVTLVACIIAYLSILIGLGKFNYKTDLPLDICNISSILIPFLMWKPSFKAHEILYFWVLVGTTQAMLTPHLYNGFPNFIFLKYWITHAGLTLFIIYNTVVFDLKPNLKSIWKSFAVLQGYILFILAFNYIVGSNYVYVLHKPPTSSPLDYLGPWPWYVIACELIGLLLFFVVFIPLWVTSRKNRSPITT